MHICFVGSPRITQFFHQVGRGGNEKVMLGMVMVGIEIVKGNPIVVVVLLVVVGTGGGVLVPSL